MCSTCGLMDWVRIIRESGKEFEEQVTPSAYSIAVTSLFPRNEKMFTPIAVNGYNDIRETR